MTLGGRVRLFPLADHDIQPGFITTGPDGNLWFTEVYGNNIGRITLTGRVTEFPLPTPNSGPTGIATGADGNLWVTETCSNSIAHITPVGNVKEFRISSSTHWNGTYCIPPI